MDFEHALNIFNTLYQDVNGYTLSTAGRAELGTDDKAFVYGEISPEAFYSILKNLPVNAQGNFYDLGSGTGKAVILAHLLFPFKKTVGIELLKPLYIESTHIQSMFEREFGALHRSKNKMKFVHGDFLKYDFSDADVVFMHSTCFPEYMWSKLEPKMEKLKKGTCVITVTKTFESIHLDHLKSKEYGMAWGRATVHFYEKR